MERIWERRAVGVYAEDVRQHCKPQCPERVKTVMSAIGHYQSVNYSPYKRLRRVMSLNLGVEKRGW